MSLSSTDTDSKGLGKRKLQLTSVQERRLIDDDGHPCKKIFKPLSITDLPEDCLNLVYKSIKFGADHSSFGLVCRHWLRIQNNNHESLWDIDSKCSLRKSKDISSESFSIILCKLLIRFQHLKRLSLSGFPEVTDYVKSQSQLFGSKIHFLCLKVFFEYSCKKLLLLFSSFPRLTSVRLSSCLIADEGLEVLAKCYPSLVKFDLRNCQRITNKGLKVLAKCCASLKKVNFGECPRISDKGLVVLAKCCASLEKVNFRDCRRITAKGLQVLAECCASLEKVELGRCQKISDKGLEILAKRCAFLKRVDLTDCEGITDSGISFIVQNCFKIHSVRISFCSNITGIGFLGCLETLTDVSAVGMHKLTTEGIKAISSGGGIRSLALSGNPVNDKAVITISKGCPLLKSLALYSCHEVHLEGWKAIGLYCRNLKSLYVDDCPKLCDEGLKALCYGCNKLSCLFVDGWRDSAFEAFKQERPSVHLI
ncbi:hypothetical protein MKW98_020741 [Papaver atlanticum]|uniref:F-box/LRR-repeat protein 15-like leucin rich repeat domain-containing protein n=1 Tax=Papaver atlanticum TaxID=357466 RepID=A0AAD4TFK3_9MAGN|nr:hypothetical protein MKW98_020741 [Papaver atlanticum]